MFSAAGRERAIKAEAVYCRAITDTIGELLLPLGLRLRYDRSLIITPSAAIDRTTDASLWRCVELGHSFTDIYNWLRKNDSVAVQTDAGSRLKRAMASERDGTLMVRFFHRGREYGRVYACCWSRYNNCLRIPVANFAPLSIGRSHLLVLEDLYSEKRFTFIAEKPAGPPRN